MSAGATNHVLTTLVASFDHDPCAMLTCLVPLPLKSNLRHCALVYLQSAVKVTDHAFTLVQVPLHLQYLLVYSVPIYQDLQYNLGS